MAMFCHVTNSTPTSLFRAKLVGQRGRFDLQTIRERHYMSGPSPVPRNVGLSCPVRRLFRVSGHCF
jgi:hypothetical protein